MIDTTDTIAAVATGVGGAIAIVRISGPQALDICGRMFSAASGKDIRRAPGYTLHYGRITDEKGTIVDDVIVSLFRAPKSYTGEDMVEISCHGSAFIQREILRLVVLHGGRLAGPGEFTVRAFLAGKMDLAQAEAVADTIAAGDRASHAIAANQIRGGYSDEFADLRGRLLHILSLLELELDFSEEDVEFADRSQLRDLLSSAIAKIEGLAHSFELGNAIKEGVPVAIIGSPNAGKSTLLNAILKDDRAMVSDIAGTTRDSIEESAVIDGLTYRFIDTAGIRDTADALERMGIERTFAAATKARIILLLIDGNRPQDDILKESETTLSRIDLTGKSVCILINKIDAVTETAARTAIQTVRESCDRADAVIGVSAKYSEGLADLKHFLHATVNADAVYEGANIVSNSRHWEALQNAGTSLVSAQTAVENGISGDLIAQDLRAALHHLGIITGEITTDEILGEIFSKFCIGK